jgi:hypothetical protein
MPNCQKCNAKATHGLKGGSKIYCKDCAKNVEGVGDLTRKHCKEATCFKEPTYNYPTEKTTAYCTVHKLPGMVDVKHPKCQHVDENGNRCDKGPTYGPEGGKAIYCEPHSNLYENMVMVITNRLCKYVDDDGNKCGSRASFNLPGNISGKWCKKHKGPNDKFVLKTIYCEVEGCETRASQNYKNEKKPRFCEEHRLIGMCNIIDKRCEVQECIKMATYAGKDSIKRFCAEHKLEGMKDIRSKQCAFEGCNKEPTYNVPGTKVRLFCAEHADKNTMDNVKSKKCIKCKVKEAFCNFKGINQRLYCIKCRDEDMVQLNTKICKNDNESYKCTTRIPHTRYDGYCLRCYTHLFPDATITKSYKTKELRVIEFIKNTFTNTKIVCNKTVPNGMSKRRPDICINNDDYNIIIEVDEYQHNSYEDICENKRVMELFVDLQNKPLVMIRFNPDDYINDKGKKIKTCWSVAKNGLVVLNKNKIIDWNNRLNKLKDTLEYYLHYPPKKEVEIIYLYYDDMKNEKNLEEDFQYDDIIIA